MMKKKKLKTRTEIFVVLTSDKIEQEKITKFPGKKSKSPKSSRHIWLKVLCFLFKMSDIEIEKEMIMIKMMTI